MKKSADPPLSPPPDVVIIEDDLLFQQSLARMLRSQGYAPMVYGSMAEFKAAGAVPQTGCVILDLNLPGADGLQIQEELAKSAPSLSIVFLTGFGKVSSSVRAMKSGAVDFFEKPVDDSVLRDAVKRAIDRSVSLDRSRAEVVKLLARYRRLTTREREVFALITSGLLNKQAAAELQITEKTVKVHRGRVMQKMEAGSLADLVRFAEGIWSNSNSANQGAADSCDGRAAARRETR